MSPDARTDGRTTTASPITVTVTVRGETLNLVGDVVYLDRIQGFAVTFANNPPEIVERLKGVLA